MQLYAGTTTQFVEDSVQNQIAQKLRNAWFGQYRYYPSPSEVRSWQNSLRAMSQVVERAQLRNHGLLLEYQLPMTSRRLDCVITGRSSSADSAVVIELKQWERCEPADGDLVVTWLGGGHRETLHPSVQCDRYCQYLQDCHTAFYGDGAVELQGCTYLHNYSFIQHDPLLDAKFADVVGRTPVFSQNDVDRLTGFLIDRLAEGDGLETLKRVQESSFRPSKRLMDHVGGVVKGRSEYILLDEQAVVHDKILTLLRKGYHQHQKHVVLVRGGPGTGKSVIAINLLANLLLSGYSSHYATGSKAFTETLRKKIGTRGNELFRYFNSYGGAGRDEIDVLVLDEAHRIRKSSASRFTKKANQTGLPQVDELLKAAKVSVFLIDDDQVVRPNEIGSSSYIREAAARAGATLHEFELEAQFRCAGSDAFISWVNNTLRIRDTANVLWDPADAFDFRIMESPHELEKAIRAKQQHGFSARMVAGFCWEWSPPRPDGTLVNDVTVGDYERPWNASHDARRLAKGIPKASVWATEPGGIDQIGCIYTAQGFEFDYVGVIFGNDLTYDPDQADWAGHPGRSRDTQVNRSKDSFLRLVKNTYRVLLTRGLKGCYVYFVDQPTRNFVRSRMASSPVPP